MQRMTLGVKKAVKQGQTAGQTEGVTYENPYELQRLLQKSHRNDYMRQPARKATETDTQPQSRFWRRKLSLYKRELERKELRKAATE